ncbi:MAG TPA: glycerate kinase, partial [Gaiellaceae bacterium]|nr:glycerate kinase [Gaiellaceae bacterium]
MVAGAGWVGRDAMAGPGAGDVPRILRQCIGVRVHPLTSAVVCPDKFRGTLEGPEAAAAMAAGVRRAGFETVRELPLADGGEGTLDALAAGLDAERRRAAVTDPLGRPIEAEFGLAGEVALVDTAAASGLSLVAEAERDAFAASTAGTGGLIAAAIEAGARTV